MLIRRVLVLPLLMAFVSPAGAAETAAMTDHPAAIIRLPQDMPWRGRPGGNQTALLLGDTAKPGTFVSIINWVSGSISKPHYHPNARTFVVLKGHWDFGSGPHYDPAAMKALPEGTVVTVPAGGILYDGCKEAPCMVEVIGVGQDPEYMVDETGATLPPEKQ
jgi:hypothetical protein